MSHPIPRLPTDGLIFYVLNERTGNAVAGFMFYHEAVEYVQRRVNAARPVVQQLAIVDPDGDPIQT